MTIKRNIELKYMYMHQVDHFPTVKHRNMRRNCPPQLQNEAARSAEQTGLRGGLTCDKHDESGNLQDVDAHLPAADDRQHDADDVEEHRHDEERKVCAHQV